MPVANYTRHHPLSGHAHLYERYTRTVGSKQIPYLVAGMGGYYDLPGLKPPNQRPTAPSTPASGTDASGNPLRLEVYNDNTFGYLRVTVSPASITGVFVTVDPTSGKTGVGDSFTVNLKTNAVSSGASTAAASSKVKAGSGTSAKSAPKAAPPVKAKGKSTPARKK